MARASPVHLQSTAAGLRVLCCVCFASAVKNPPPNFLFMLADDWGWGDVGAYGANTNFALSGSRTQTPTLDALVRNGTLFTDFHVAQSFCAPSRTAFMTGRFPADLHVNTNWETGAGGADWNHRHSMQDCRVIKSFVPVVALKAAVYCCFICS
eukprot:m.348570 g.348570  ORF g.348570 m.348570 type:complete len:153 (-) comp20676_c0_seq2:1699-2157(-)